jgi:hypothetical protein
MTVERARVSQVALMGVYADLATSVFRDLEVGEVPNDPTLGIAGRCFSVGPGGAVTIERARFVGGQSFGLFVGGLGASLDATELTIRGEECTECAGIGLGVYRTAVASVSGFIIEDNAVAGVQVALGGVLDLSDGFVRGNPIGVALDDADYDVDRLMSGVRYADNGTNLDSVALPVPPSDQLDFTPGDEPESP